jgi:tRNA U38,U39,U40 pseudouridine synthase TruA
MGRTLLEAGKGSLAPADIRGLLELRDRPRSGPTIPPEGLPLVSLEYPDPTDSLASTARRLRSSP